MKSNYLLSLLSRSLVATLCVSMPSSFTLAKDTTLPLSHVVVKFDTANWVGKELKVGDAKNKSAVLNNAAESLVVIVIDIVAAKSKDDLPIAARTLASQMAKEKYAAYSSVSEKNSLPTMASKHFANGWSCVQSVLKKTPNADDMYSTYCVATDRKFEVYAFLETRQPVTDKGMNLFKSLLTDITPK